MAEAPRMICATGAAIGEGPVLHAGALRLSDPVERRLLTVGSDGTLHSASVDASIWSLAVLPNIRLAGTLDDCFAVIENDAIGERGPTASLPAGTRFNDMVASDAGALWTGAMHRGVLATRGAIFHAASVEDTPRCVAEGLGVPNGMALSTDSATLFMVDTLARTLLAFAVAGERLGEPTIVTDFLSLPGKPDGMAIDARGRFHVAMWGGACVAHIDADGATLGTTPIPAPHVSSVCISSSGGLLVTTSRMRLSTAVLASFPELGNVFEISGESMP